MSPEFIAIISTAAFQASLLGAALWMVYQQGKILERIEGTCSAIFLDGRKERQEIRSRIEEVNRMMREELLKK